MHTAVLALLALTFAVLPFVGPAAADAATEKAAYTVRFDGLEAVPELATLLRDSSTLVGRRDDPPPSPAALRRRVDGDIAGFETAATFEAEIRPAAPGLSEAAPLEVVIAAVPGALYTVDEIEIRSTDDASPAVGINLPRDRLALKLGAAARAADVIAAEGEIVRMLHERGHPLAEAGDRTVLVDHDAAAMRVTYRVDTGPAARFGPVAVEGAETVDPGFVLRRLPWRFGETADARRVEEARRNLASTGLFTTVGVQFGEAVDAEGLLPVRVSVTERPHRTIGAGLGLSTAEGFSVNAFWTHRNLFGGAERLDIAARLGEVESKLTGDLRLPDVFLNDQDLVLSAGVSQENTDGYDAQRIAVGGRFERRVSAILTVDYGMTLERSLIDENGEEKRFNLVGLPVGATVDTSDDLLNPTRGGRSRVRFTPYLATLGSSVGFYSVTARHSHYLALDNAGDLVLAGRVGAGATVGASTGNLPADKRFYAGGSGSVRGYGFQKIGPLDASNDPLGGRSMFEFGAELRWRVHGDFGIVPFIDGGQVYETETPDFGAPIQWAAGLGLRYYTPIGPIRADIAFPLNPRSSDDRFQVYFSLGQAF